MINVVDRTDQNPRPGLSKCEKASIDFDKDQILSRTFGPSRTGTNSFRDFESSRIPDSECNRLAANLALRWVHRQVPTT